MHLYFIMVFVNAQKEESELPSPLNGRKNEETEQSL